MAEGGSAPCKVVVCFQTCMEWFAVLVCSEVLPVLKHIILFLKTRTQWKNLCLISQWVFFLSLCKCPSLGDDAGEEQHTR